MKKQPFGEIALNLKIDLVTFFCGRSHILVMEKGLFSLFSQRYVYIDAFQIVGQHWPNTNAADLEKFEELMNISPLFYFFIIYQTREI